MPEQFRICGRSASRTALAWVSERARPGTLAGREMITLKHLVAFRGFGPGPYLESWPKIVMIALLVAVVAGTVAIVNRRGYRR